MKKILLIILIVLLLLPAGFAQESGTAIPLNPESDTDAPLNPPEFEIREQPADLNATDPDSLNVPQFTEPVFAFPSFFGLDTDDPLKAVLDLAVVIIIIIIAGLIGYLLLRRRARKRAIFEAEIIKELKKKTVSEKSRRSKSKKRVK